MVLCQLSSSSPCPSDPAFPFSCQHITIHFCLNQGQPASVTSLGLESGRDKAHWGAPSNLRAKWGSADQLPLGIMMDPSFGFCLEPYWFTMTPITVNAYSQLCEDSGKTGLFLPLELLLRCWGTLPDWCDVGSITETRTLEE